MKKNDQQLFLIALVVFGTYLLMRNKRSTATPIFPFPTNGGTSVIPKTYFVSTSGSKLNVRKEPNTSSMVVTQLANGSEFMGMPSLSDPKWVIVTSPSGGVLGYVSSTFVRLK
jgi:hypothetical protein